MLIIVSFPGNANQNPSKIPLHTMEYGCNKQTIIRVTEYLEKLESSYIAGGNVKLLEKAVLRFLKY